MERDEAAADAGPVLVDRLSRAQKPMLCGEMSSSMKGMGGGM